MATPFSKIICITFFIFLFLFLTLSIAFNNYDLINKNENPEEFNAIASTQQVSESKKDEVNRHVIQQAIYGELERRIEEIRKNHTDTPHDKNRR